MNGWGALLWLTSVLAVLSIPIVLFARVMHVVNRIGDRTMIVILVAALVVWGMACCWWLRGHG